MNAIAYGALWLFVFALPWEGIIRLGNINLATLATGVLAAGCAAFAVIVSARMRRWHLFHVAALLFVMTVGLELLLFYDMGPRPPSKFYTYVQLVVMVWMIWEIAPSRSRMLGLLLAYIYGAYLAAFQTLWVFHKTGGGLKRFAVSGIDPNDLAVVLSLGIPMAWYLGITHAKPVVRWICRLYLPVAIVTIGLTGSRGGLMTAIIALTIVPLSMIRLSPGRLTMTIGMLLLSGALAVVYIPETIVERLATTSTEVQDLHVGGRFKLWRAGIRALPEHPLLGFGVSGYIRAITPQLGPAAQVAHNTFISVLVEQGLIGFSLYLLMFIAAFRAVRRLPLLERRFGLVLMATLVMAMMPLTWEHRKPLWFVLAALVGLSEAFRAAAVSRAARIRAEAPLVRSPGAFRPVGPAAAHPRDIGA